MAHTNENAYVSQTRSEYQGKIWDGILEGYHYFGPLHILMVQDKRNYLLKAKERGVLFGLLFRELESVISPDSFDNVQEVYMKQELNYVDQVLGKALGYPKYSDDPANFPTATEQDGVCTGDNAPGTLALEAASLIRKLSDEVELLRKELQSL